MNLARVLTFWKIQNLHGAVTLSIICVGAFRSELP